MNKYLLFMILSICAIDIAGKGGGGPYYPPRKKKPGTTCIFNIDKGICVLTTAIAVRPPPRPLPIGSYPRTTPAPTPQFIGRAGW